MKTYTLWHGHFPLIEYYGASAHDERGAYRVASDTMTQGAFPAHIMCRDKAERLAKIYAIDGDALDIQLAELDL